MGVYSIHHGVEGVEVWSTDSIVLKATSKNYNDLGNLLIVSTLSP